jgi:hypothetical protein
VRKSIVHKPWSVRDDGSECAYLFWFDEFHFRLCLVQLDGLRRISYSKGYGATVIHHLLKGTLSAVESSKKEVSTFCFAVGEALHGDSFGRRGMNLLATVRGKKDSLQGYWNTRRVGRFGSHDDYYMFRS